MMKLQHNHDFAERDGIPSFQRAGYHLKWELAGLGVLAMLYVLSLVLYA